MRPLAIHHVSVNVADVEAASRFYVDVLGATPRADSPELSFGGAWLDLGGQQLHLLEGATPASLGQHFAILVADVDEAVDELRAKGVKVGDPVAIGPARQTFVRDPSGNVIELHQRPD